MIPLHNCQEIMVPWINCSHSVTFVDSKLTILSFFKDSWKRESSLWKSQVVTYGFCGQLIKGGSQWVVICLRQGICVSLYDEQLVCQAPNPGVIHIYWLLCWKMSIVGLLLFFFLIIFLGLLDIVEKFIEKVPDSCIWRLTTSLVGSLLTDWWTSFSSLHLPRPFFFFF